MMKWTWNFSSTFHLEIRILLFIQHDQFFVSFSSKMSSCGPLIFSRLVNWYYWLVVLKHLSSNILRWWILTRLFTPASGTKPFLLWNYVLSMGPSIPHCNSKNHAWNLRKIHHPGRLSHSILFLQALLSDALGTSIV